MKLKIYTYISEDKQLESITCLEEMSEYTDLVAFAQS